METDVECVFGCNGVVGGCNFDVGEGAGFDGRSDGCGGELGEVVAGVDGDGERGGVRVEVGES